jgi:hypothetical protein
MTCSGRILTLLRRTNCRTALPALFCLVLSPLPLFAAGSDVLVLQNGDRITGEVKKLAGGRLEFKTDKAGTLQVQWDAVGSLTSTRFFEVLLDDASRLYGELQPAASEKTLRVGTGAEATDAPLSKIAQIDRLRKTFWGRIKGSVDLGLTYTKADSKTEWNFDAQTSVRTPKRKLSLSLDSTFRHSTAGDFDREDLSGQFQRFFGGRWLALGFGTFQRNSELNLDSRVLAGGGAGLHLVRNVENDLVIAGGIAASSEKFTDTRPNSESVEALLGLEYNLYALGGREFTVAASFTLFPSLSVKGRVRAEASVNLRKELFKDFYLNLQFFDSFDNQADASAATQNDLGATTSFGWSF